MKKSKTNNIYQPKLNQTKTIIQHPFKLKEKLKLINNDQSSNINKIKISDKNFLKKFSFAINKKKISFNKTTLNFSEKPNLPSIKVLNFKKNIKIKQKPQQINSINFNATLKKIRCSSQELNERTIIPKNNNYKLNNDDVDVDNSKIGDINEFMNKVNKEYGDIGKIIKINLILDKDRKFEFEKNEHILLKIIENDLKENYGLDVKEFILNDKKLNVFRSLKENNIENNSVINIII